VDLIYNPEKTIFLKRAEERGAVVLNGLTMLKLQAEKAYEIFMTE
jgi:shikimate dehydrogenase